MTVSRVAVTGASGFIGRHVIAALARYPVTVTAVTRDAARLANVGKGVRVVELDIACPHADDYERLNRPEVLIHLAWEGLPNYESARHVETELSRQYHFLRTLIENGLPALLVSGTCLEYGLQSGELSEDLATLPATPYGHAKDSLRRELELLRSKHDCGLTWARLFYMYGEGQAEHSLYAQLEKAVARGDRLFDMSEGEQVRDYLPVTEVALALVALALLQANAGVVNVCSGKPVSVRNLVEGWIRSNGWSITLNLGQHPYAVHEPMAFWGKACKLRDSLAADATTHERHLRSKLNLGHGTITRAALPTLSDLKS